MRQLLVFLLLFLGYCTAFSQDSLHFTFPTPNAKIIAGSDTIIAWQGVAESDTVSLEYSKDNGKTWLLLTKKSDENSFLWNNIPNKIGNNYLMRMIHKGEIYHKLDEPYIEWSKTYGGSYWDALYDIKELNEGGYIAVGTSKSNDFDLSNNKGINDIWVLKVDSNGNLIYSKNFGGSKRDEANNIELAKDGGFIITGLACSQDGDFPERELSAFQFLMKFDKNAEMEWVKTYGYCALPDLFDDIKETNDGGYILVGDTTYTHPCAAGKDNVGISHIYVLKVDKNGNYEWSKSYGGNHIDASFSIEICLDGSYIIGGNTNSDCGDITENTAGGQAWVLKLDIRGNLEWQKTYGGSGKGEFASSIKVTEDGGYILLGSTDSRDGNITDFHGGIMDVWTMKLNNKGEIVWSKTYGGSGDESSSNATCFNITTDNCLIFAATTTSSDGDITKNYGGNDGWFVKIDRKGEIKYQRTFGGTYSDYPYSTEQTSDLGYILAGMTWSHDGDVTENRGGYDGWIIKLSTKYQPIDTLIVPFSIVAPQPAALDVDMGKVFVGEWRDSTVARFVYNIGDYKFRVDSIYIKGANKAAFSLIGGFPKYNVEPDSGREARFRFTPSRVGLHSAKIYIITQTDTLIQNIIGEGLQKKARIQVELEPYVDLICDNSTATTLKISSTGNENLIVNALNIIGADKADFTLNQTLPFTLAPDSTKTIAIGFKTNVPGIKTASLEIKSNADPDSVLTLPLTVRKDSIALVPNPTLIDLGVLFPNQTKDTSFVISNLGTIKTDGKVTFTNNINCSNPMFTIDSGATHQLDFTFMGLPADGNINEKITVWDEVCKYFREVLITGKVVSPQLQGFTAIQCKSYENEYKLTLNNPSSNKLKITSIVFEKNPSLFQIDPNLVFPISITPFTTNYEVKVTYQDNIAQKFKTAVNFFTDNKFVPVITDTVFVETVDYIRTTSGLINDEIHDASNQFAVSYDANSEFGKNKFTYSIKVNENRDEMVNLTQLNDLEIVINYNSNVIGADLNAPTGKLKLRLSNDLAANYTIKTAKENKIDEFNSQIVVNLVNTGKPIISKNAYKLLELDFSAYLGKENLSNEQNSVNSRNAIISHIINSSDECISYETAENAFLSIEKLCVDDIRSITIPSDTSAKFYLGDVIPHPIGTEGASIEYGLGFECEVTLTIYDISGAVVLTPINEIQKAGIHKQSISRKLLLAGTYFIEMKAGPFKETKRVIVE